MKRIFSQKAISLLELIIASILVAVVVLGLFAINSVLNNNNVDYGQKYFVKSETQATLNHILNDVALAVGSGTSDSYGNLDLGVLDDSNSPNLDPNHNTFCVHQSPSGNPGNIAAPKPDIWVCYTWYPSTYASAPNQIYYCDFTYVPAIGPSSYRGAAACIQGASGLVSGTSPTFLGTAFSIANLNGNPSPPSFASNTFTITIQNCLNNADVPNCNNSGTSGDPASNPEVQLTGSISPPQEGG